MTPKETKAVLALMRAAYPQFYKDMSREALNSVVNLWQKQFEDYDGLLVLNAVNTLISSRVEGYPPTIGAVKQQIMKLYAAELPSESEAWAMVSLAAQNGAYGWKAEFEALPPLVQRAVGSAEQLRAWALMEEGEVQTIVASTFKKAYRQLLSQEQEWRLLPGFVIASLQKEQDGMCLPDACLASCLPETRKGENHEVRPGTRSVSDEGVTQNCPLSDG